MKPPTNQAISDTLRRITVSQLPDDHPRQLARQAVMEFRSNAQRESSVPPAECRCAAGATPTFLCDHRPVRQWQSDATREGLPIANVHDDKGAPVLMRDEVVRTSIPNHAEPPVKTRRGWWRRLFGR